MIIIIIIIKFLKNIFKIKINCVIMSVNNINKLYIYALHTILLLYIFYFIFNFQSMKYVFHKINSNLP